MADDVALKEEQELEALLGLMGQGDQASKTQDEEMDSLLWELSHTPAPPPPETLYGSDDEEYDHIFMDVIQEEYRMSSEQSQQQPAYVINDQDMMDMS